ncbi:MAG: RsmB/NOP family class I SAM-dependent RNA methyltransferase [Pseudomonadota bacterium]
MRKTRPRGPGHPAGADRKLGPQANRREHRATTPIGSRRRLPEISARSNVSALVLDLWEKTRIDWGFATDQIAQTFRREKWLSSEERRQVAEHLYGMIRQARRVDYALERAGARIPPCSEREQARYLAYLVLEGTIDARKASAMMPAVSWQAVASVDEHIRREHDPARRLALRRSLPDWLARRFLDEYPADADPLAESLNQRAPLTVRANAAKIAREGLAELLAAVGVASRPTQYARHGLHILHGPGQSKGINVFALRAFREGLLEPQDEASQLVAELVDPRPKGLVIDACAGAGGKTLALAAQLGGCGRVIALDVSERKLAELRRRARRANLSNIRTIVIEPDRWPSEVEALVGKADRVLVDAPCSGIGALRRNPEARWRLHEEDTLRLAREQQQIVTRAAGLLAPGGRLLYATCTMLRTENEEVIARFLDSQRDFARLPVKDLVGEGRIRCPTDADGMCLRTLPHLHGMDGFFAALFFRASQTGKA